MGSILLERANRVAAQDTMSIPSVFFDRIAAVYDAAHGSFHTKMSVQTGVNHAPDDPYTTQGRYSESVIVSVIRYSAMGSKQC